MDSILSKGFLEFHYVNAPQCRVSGSLFDGTSGCFRAVVNIIPRNTFLKVELLGQRSQGLPGSHTLAQPDSLWGVLHWSGLALSTSNAGLAVKPIHVLTVIHSFTHSFIVISSGPGPRCWGFTQGLAQPSETSSLGLNLPLL